MKKLTTTITLMTKRTSTMKLGRKWETSQEDYPLNCKKEYSFMRQLNQKILFYIDHVCWTFQNSIATITHFNVFSRKQLNVSSTTLCKQKMSFQRTSVIKQMGESQTVVSRKQSTPNFKKPVSSLQKTPFLLQNAAGIIKRSRYYKISLF